MAIARVRTVLSGWVGGPGLSTMYFLGAGSIPTGAEVNDAGARVRAFWQSFAAQLPVGVTATVSNVVDIVDQSTGVLLTSGVVVPTPVAVAGTAAAEPAPPGIMANFTYDTGVVILGRKLRGRSFIGPLTEGATASGVLAPSVITALQAAGPPLISATPTQVKLAVWSRPQVGRPGQVAQVSSFLVPAKLAHLRSRRD